MEKCLPKLKKNGCNGGKIYAPAARSTCTTPPASNTGNEGQAGNALAFIPRCARNITLRTPQNSRPAWPQIWRLIEQMVSISAPKVARGMKPQKMDSGSDKPPARPTMTSTNALGLTPVPSTSASPSRLRWTNNQGRPARTFLLF